MGFFTSIIAGAFVLLVALLYWICKSIDIIRTIFIVLYTILSVVVIVLNFKKEATVGNKILGTFILIVAIVVGYIMALTLVNGIDETMANMNDLLFFIELPFVVIFGGGLFIVCFSMLSRAIYLCVEKEEDLWGIKAIGLILVSVLIGSIFGLI